MRTEDSEVTAELIGSAHVGYYDITQPQLARITEVH